MIDYDSINCSVIINSKMEASKFNNFGNGVTGEYSSPYMTVNVTKVDDYHYAKFETQPTTFKNYLNHMVASSNVFSSEKLTKREDFSSLVRTSLNTLNFNDHLIPLSHVNFSSNILIESGASVLTSSWNSFLDNNSSIIRTVKDSGRISFPISANTNVGAYSSCNQLNSLIVGDYITNADKYDRQTQFSASSKINVGVSSLYNQVNSIVVGGYVTNDDKYASQVQFPTSMKVNVGVSSLYSQVNSLNVASYVTNADKYASQVQFPINAMVNVGTFPSTNQVNNLISSSINNSAVYSSQSWVPTYEKINAGDNSTYNHSNAIIDSFGSLGNIGMRVANNSLYSSHTIPYIESDITYTKINLNQYAGLFNKELDSCNFALYSKYKESRSSVEKAICTVLNNMSSKPEHFGINYIEAAENTLIINVFFILNGNISGEYVHIGNNITKALSS